MKALLDALIENATDQRRRAARITGQRRGRL